MCEEGEPIACGDGDDDCAMGKTLGPEARPGIKSKDFFIKNKSQNRNLATGAKFTRLTRQVECWTQRRVNGCAGVV
jgi:hypothetical protein